MAAFAYGLIFAPEKVWEPLKSNAKNNFEKWLYSINDKEVCDSNWTFFRVLVNVALKRSAENTVKNSWTKILQG